MPSSPSPAVRRWSRRGLVTTGTAAAGTVVAGALSGPAHAAAVRYRPATYARTPLPTAQARHLASRFAYGMTPALHQQMRGAGGPVSWFERQLAPHTIADGAADAMSSWWYSLNASPETLWERSRTGVEGGWEAMANYGSWCLARRIHSQRQVLEVMTEFWENHLHVSVSSDGVFTHRAAYGRTIRSHALGRYEDLLHAAVTHPAMGIFLDNAISTAKAPNENLGRELLELHTVGTGNFTEADVKSSARILTGFRVDMWRSWEAYYDPASHARGPVKVLDFTHGNWSSDGREVARAYLSYLARHPLTAQRIARRLAVRFVSDSPPQALVDQLASVYLRSGTAIVPVLRALVASPSFWASAGAKVRTPTDDVVATNRVLQVRFARPTGKQSAANVAQRQSGQIGQTPFSWPRPDGQPQDNASWSSASRMLASFDFHADLAAGGWPRYQVAYRTPGQWVPARGITFDRLVDHLCRTILAQPSTATLLEACCLAAECGPRDRITPKHAVLRWRMPHVLAALLDTPHHLAR